jgi:hypothetical protein
MDYVKHYVIMGLMLQRTTPRFVIVALSSLKQLVHSDDPAVWNGLPPEDYVRGAAHELLNQLTGIKVVLDYVQIAAEDGAPSPGTFIGFDERDWNELMSVAQDNCNTIIRLLNNMYAYADAQPPIAAEPIRCTGQCQKVVLPTAD